MKNGKMFMYIKDRKALKDELDKKDSGPRLILLGTETDRSTYLYYNDATFNKTKKPTDTTPEMYIDEYPNVIFVFGDNVGSNKKYKDDLERKYGDAWQANYFNLAIKPDEFKHGGSGQAATMLSNSAVGGSKWVPNVMGLPICYASKDKILSAIDTACEEIKIHLRMRRTVVIPAANQNLTSIGRGIASNNPSSMDNAGPEILAKLNQKIKELEKYADELHSSKKNELFTDKARGLEDYLKHSQPPAKKPSSTSSSTASGSSSSSVTSTNNSTIIPANNTRKRTSSVSNQDSKDIKLDPIAIQQPENKSKKKMKSEEALGIVGNNYEDAVKSIVGEGEVPEALKALVNTAKRKSEYNKLKSAQKKAKTNNAKKGEITPSAGYIVKINYDESKKSIKKKKKGKLTSFSTANIKARDTKKQERHVSPIAIVQHALADTLEPDISLRKAIILTLDKLEPFNASCG